MVCVCDAGYCCAHPIRRIAREIGFIECVRPLLNNVALKYTTSTSVRRSNDSLLARHLHKTGIDLLSDSTAIPIVSPLEFHFRRYLRFVDRVDLWGDPTFALPLVIITRNCSFYEC